MKFNYAKRFTFFPINMIITSSQTSRHTQIREKGKKIVLPKPPFSSFTFMQFMQYQISNMLQNAQENERKLEKDSKNRINFSFA